MFDFEKPQPLADAVAQLSQKTPIGSMLRTAEWQQMPAALRDQAFFSAGVESVRVLQRGQNVLLDILNQARDPETGAYKFDRSKFIADLQKFSLAEGLKPAEPEKQGGLLDPTAEARLGLIYETQIGLAQGKAYWLQGQDPDILNAWPAQELVRVKARKKPRNWKERWRAAGGEFHGGRMIALKTDPIWTKISRFGTPYPPFDFNSGMGLEEIDREEAEKLGVLLPGEKIKPHVDKINDELAASVASLDDKMRRALLGFFQHDQIDIDGDTVRWRPLAEQAALAVEDYTGSGFQQINEELRDGDESPRVQRRRDRLNDFLDKLPDHQGEVYRGTDDTYDLSKYRDNVGGEITEDAFTSTSTDPEKAFNGPVRYVIFSKHGKFVDPYSSAEGEDEVLFKAGTKFRVLDFDEIGDETHIVLDEI